jgi:hypothetical protein
VERVLTVTGGVGLYDSPKFITAEDESLEIKLVVEREYRQGLFRFVLRHGNAPIIEKQIKNGQSIVLTPKWIKAGKNNPIEIDLYFLTRDCTKLLNDNYQIEPLYVEKLEATFEYTASVQALEEKFKDLEKRYAILQKRVEEYEKNGIELVPEEEVQEEKIEEKENNYEEN